MEGDVEDLVSDAPVTRVVGVAVAARAEECQLADPSSVDDLGGIGDARTVAACGVSLGRGREPVLCVVGDGSAMYSPQALWTAARERLPVLFAVVNNQQYAIIK